MVKGRANVVSKTQVKHILVGIILLKMLGTQKVFEIFEEK